jgi:hypothetical protein
MPSRQIVERPGITRVAALGQMGTLEELIRDSLKGRHDHCDRLAPACGRHDVADGTHVRRAGQ